MKNEVFVKWYKKVVKLLVPFSFFVIANVNDVIGANAIAGVMTILVLFLYVINHLESK